MFSLCPTGEKGYKKGARCFTALQEHPRLTFYACGVPVSWQPPKG
jgi:hypothetical protein